jgi:hypothetical protein
VQKVKTRMIRLASDFKTEMSELRKTYFSFVDPVQNDPLYDDLKCYPQKLVSRISHVTTEQRLSDEILSVVLNPEVIGDERSLAWSQSDQNRLNQLNVECKKLRKGSDWYWDPEPGSNQAIYKQKRLELCIKEELQYETVHSTQCKTDSLMVGIDQLGSDGCCYECLLLRGHETRSAEKEKMAAWDKVHLCRYKTFKKKGNRTHS